MSESVMMPTDNPHVKGVCWCNSRGDYHRVDGPATVYEDGFKSWWIHGRRHRLNGPAIEYEDGSKAWYVDGECLGYDEEGFWALWKRLTPEQKKDPTLLSYLPGDFNVRICDGNQLFGK